MPDLEITSVLQLSFHEGVGDHRTVIGDISTSSTIGKFERQVVTPQARRLATKNTASVKGCIKYVTTQCPQHKIQERFNNVTFKAKEGTFTPADTLDSDRLDIQKTKIQRGGERQCRKIKIPALPFSPPIQELDLCQRAYVNLVKWHKSSQSSSKHIFHEAACHGIENPRKLTVKHCKQVAAACRKLLKEYKEDASHLRRVHLGNRYKLASDLKDSKKCAWIKEIMMREQQEDN
jgi:hypothetical protein